MEVNIFGPEVKKREEIKKNQLFLKWTLKIKMILCLKKHGPALTTELSGAIKSTL